MNDKQAAFTNYGEGWPFAQATGEGSVKAASATCGGCARKPPPLAHNTNSHKAGGWAMGSQSVLCKSCGHEGNIETFPPAMSVYQDIICPKCGSTHNEHNAEYQDRLFAAMRKSEESNK